MALIDNLIQALQVLPGVGPKSAQRMALTLLQRNRNGGTALGNVLLQAMESVKRCAVCQNLTESDVCPVCSDTRRDATMRGIETAAAEKQSKIDAGDDKIVGLNLFPGRAPESMEVLKVDHHAVLKGQKERLKQLRSKRNDAAVKAALAALESGASGGGNLLDLAVAAARVRCTLGEISDAVERVFDRHVPVNRPVRGIFRKHLGAREEFKLAVEKASHFAALAGRQPRILVAKMGQDGHDRGAKVIASAFADLGFDVDLGSLFQTPAEVARQAVESDVHVVGVSTLAAGHLALVPALVEALAKAGREDMLVVVGGVIPREDYDTLYGAGVTAIFGPGTPVVTSATRILDLLNEAYS